LLLAGLDDPDDAALWKLNEESVLVMTTDFFTPIVDDPFDYGQIAAANSLSDIYAMGGTPFLALNISAFPPQLPSEMASEILRGGALKALEAGVVIAGGHTIQDQEPKYGLVALGLAESAHLLTKGGMNPGDVLFLSKPIGSGIITSALKAELINEKDAQPVIDWLKKLNDKTSKLALAHGARSATDITGFSLLGHGWEMAAASKAGMRLNFEKIPFYPQTEDFAKDWAFPGGAFDNLLYYGKHFNPDRKLDQEKQLTLADPQTSGGLLFAIPKDRADACEADAIKKDIPLWRIGDVIKEQMIDVI
jgi:selenide,water dikinase